MWKSLFKSVIILSSLFAGLTALADYDLKLLRQLEKVKMEPTLQNRVELEDVLFSVFERYHAHDSKVPEKQVQRFLNSSTGHCNPEISLRNKFPNRSIFEKESILQNLFAGVSAICPNIEEIELDLSENDLRLLPFYRASLSSLFPLNIKRLSLSGNSHLNAEQIEHLPQIFPALRSLDLSRTSVREIPDSFLEFRELRSFRADECDLYNIGLLKTLNLQELSLRDSGLKAIPGAFADLFLSSETSLRAASRVTRNRFGNPNKKAIPVPYAVIQKSLSQAIRMNSNWVTDLPGIIEITAQFKTLIQEKLQESQSFQVQMEPVTFRFGTLVQCDAAKKSINKCIAFTDREIENLEALSQLKEGDRGWHPGLRFTMRKVVPIRATVIKEPEPKRSFLKRFGF